MTRVTKRGNACSTVCCTCSSSLSQKRVFLKVSISSSELPPARDHESGHDRNDSAPNFQGGPATRHLNQPIHMSAKGAFGTPEAFYPLVSQSCQTSWLLPGASERDGWLGDREKEFNYYRLL